MSSDCYSILLFLEVVDLMQVSIGVWILRLVVCMYNVDFID